MCYGVVASIQSRQFSGSAFHRFICISRVGVALHGTKNLRRGAGLAMRHIRFTMAVVFKVKVSSGIAV